MNFALVLLCFFLSGFAALLYQTAWAREFEFVLGTSEIAIVCVLAAYMGGLALGSALAGRLVNRVRRPVLVYGLLELGIALSALAVPSGIRAATWALTAWMGGQPAPPDMASVSGALFYVLVAFAVLVVPTGLMGATLPLLARHAVRREEEIGTHVGALYATNTAGAVAGAVATGFVLLPQLGLRSTVYVGALANVLVFAVAALLARRAGALAAPAADARAPSWAPFHWVLPLILLSGVASFTYEVLWTRLLGHLVGGTIQGFATMLGSFLAGIVIGSAIASRLARRRERAGIGFALCQLGTAAMSLAAFLGMELLPTLALQLGAGRAGSLGDNALIAALVLLPSSLCIGATFPFAVRLAARSEHEAGSASARVYAWNTVGSITGALASGFVLLPALHFSGTLAFAMALNLALALATAALVRPVAKVAMGLAAAGLAALAVVRPETPWSVLRHSAMPGTQTKWQGDIAFYAVGRSSTVLLIEQWNAWRLTNNGLPESLLTRSSLAPGGLEPSRWLGLLPVLLRPEISSALVVGLGGGLTVESIPRTVEQITVVELEDEVVRAHEWLAERRPVDPLADPRVRVVVNDARGALELTDARFGAIISQPSHPWTAGASHLYTREFFQLARERLEPGGVFVQWIGLAFVDEAMLRSMVATLNEAFPYVAVFRPSLSAVLFAASDAPFDPIASAGAALTAAPGDFARFGILAAEDAVAAWELAPADSAAFAQGAPAISDDDNPLATRSARMSQPLTVKRSNEILRSYDPLVEGREGFDSLDRLYLARRVAEKGANERAMRLAQTLPEGAPRLTAIGWVRNVLAPQAAAQAFRRALDDDPDAQDARFGLVRLIRRRGQGDTEWIGIAEPLEGSAAAVARGWQHAGRGEWEAVRALEPELASAPARDPSAPEAQRLRIEWRIRVGDAEARREAVGLVTAMLAETDGTTDLLLAARALAAADRPDEALLLVDYASRTRSRRAVRQDALALLDSLTPALGDEAVRPVRERLNRPQRG